VANQFGFQVDVDDVVIDSDGEYVSHTYNDVVFFKKLGFEEVLSLDHSGYEDADIIHDLNVPVPEELRGTFDFVYDGGTLEHVFDFPQCLRNVHYLLKVGGIAAFSSPSHNHVDHGFYMFSPTIYWDYFHANGYRIVKANAFEYDRYQPNGEWIVYEYDPALFQPLDLGGWGRKPLGIWFVVEKLEGSTCDVIPQQGYYVDAWSGVTEYDLHDEAVRRQGTSAQRIRDLVRSIPVIGGAMVARRRQVRRFFEDHGRQSRPPVIARY
jgi:SAM-dependent methyltransferase